MTSTPDLAPIPPAREPQAPRSPLAVAQLVLLALLVLSAVGTSVYSVAVGNGLRAAQQRIECQAGQTDQLRQAAALERDGLRPVFTTIFQGTDREAIRHALEGYQAATIKADGVRQSIPACSPGDDPNPGG